MQTIILGGGVGGLSATYYLLKKFPSMSVSLLDASNRTGGWIKSDMRRNGVIFEQAARTLRPRGDAGINTLCLIEELNLSEQVIPILSTSEAAKNRMIYAKGSLHSLPSSFMSIFKKQAPFTKSLFHILINDLIAEKKMTDDESIYDFIHRRFGQEAADYLISPLICGICAGNAKEISVNFLLHDFFQYEQQYGSICRGLARNIFKKKKSDVTINSLVSRVQKERWSIYSFSGGLQMLPNELEKAIQKMGADVMLNKTCTDIQFDKNGATLRVDDELLHTAKVISALPSEQLADLTQTQHPELSNLLKKIKFVTVAVVHLQFKKNLISNPGFGFLVAPSENLPILGIIYDSCCFPKGDNTCLTVMLGGHWFEKYFGDNSSEDFLLQTSLKHLKNILHISETPDDFKVIVLKKCIPQYAIGHKANLNKIHNYINSHHLPLSLCGSSYTGVGVNDVILSAKQTIEMLD